MPIGAAMALVIALGALAVSAAGCSRGERFREFEYEEEIVLSLDGSATVFVNTSVAALNALRGASFSTAPSAHIDRDAIRSWFSTPVARVTRRPGLSRRHGRRFLHVRLEVDDIARLGEAAPFAWSAYRFDRAGDLFTFRQDVGTSAAKEIGDVGWDGSEGVAFRVHLPSAVVYHNAGAKNLKRGNILVWEQSLRERLRGEPLALEARIESQSILSRTLLLFAASIAAVAMTFAAALWFLVRRGRRLRRI
jgi:hypothetical protein